jgi:hypothetical protein
MSRRLATAAASWGGVPQALAVLLLAPLVVLVVQAAVSMVRMQVWTTVAAVAVVGEVLYLGFRPSPSTAPTPVSVLKLRCLLASLSLAAVCAAWLFAAAAATRSAFADRTAPWHVVALAGFLVAALLAAVPLYVRTVLRRSYREPADDDPAYAELSARIRRWSERLGLPEAPVLVVSRVPGELPHLVGGAGLCCLAVPSDYPEIARGVKAAWPALADGLLDFTVVHELTHVAREHLAWRTWFRAGLSLLARWLVPGVLAIGLGSLLAGAAEPGRRVLVLAVAGWATAVTLLAVYAQMLLIARDREVLADRQAFDLLGPEPAEALRAPGGGGGGRGTEGKAVLEEYLGRFVAYQGPLFGQRLSIGEAPRGARGDPRPLGEAVARIVDRFAGTRPQPRVRVQALRAAHESGASSRAREHGLMSGLTLAVLQAVLVIDGVLLGFHDFLRLEWIWLWGCTGVLIFLIFQPVRCLEIRPFSSDSITAAVAKSHTWSVVVATAAVLLLALPAMAAYAQLSGLAITILLFLLAAHAAAAYLGAVFISCSCS